MYGILVPMKDADITTIADTPAVFPLAAILDNVGEAVSIFDKEWRMLYSNETALNMGKTTKEKVYGKVFWDVFSDLTGTIYEEYYRRAMQEQVDLTFEFYYPTIKSWIETRLYPTPETLTVFTRNITERKTATEAIRKEQERLQNTLNAANIGTWRWDFATDLYTADTLSMKFFDVKPEQVAPNDDSIYRERIYPDDLAAVDEALSRTAQYGEPYAHTYRVIHRDGSVHWIDGRGHLEFDGTGNAIALIGTVTDVTAHKEAEEKYRRLIENVDQGYCYAEILYDAQGHPVDHRYLEVNAAFETMSGLADAKGRTAREMIPGLDQWWVEVYAKVAETGKPTHFQQYLEQLDRTLDIFASAMDIKHVVILFTDVSEKVRREREMEALNERLRRAMAETHHRVKNNLQVITSLVEMQASDMPDEILATPLLRINQHVQTLAVIHDLLTQQAKFDGDTEHLSTDSVLETLLPLLQNTIGERHLVAEAENIVLTSEQAASFALLVSECVSNAVKHAKDGKIEINLRRRDSTAILEVCDDGEGFPPNFDPRTAANTGLQLIESAARWDLRGSVEYDNPEGGGGRVTVTFPFAEPTSGEIARTGV